MKVLLVNPPNCGRSIPEERFGIHSIKQIFRGEPLALETLAGNLPEHETRILDLKVEPDALENTLADFQPDVVGLTGMTCEANTVLRLARQVKEHREIPVVVGGIHASNHPDFFNRASVDFVVTGLGTASFREIIHRLEKKESPEEIACAVPGTGATNPSGNLRLTPRVFGENDLAEEHAPAYHLVERYRSEYHLASLGLNMGFVVSAYGCPHGCAFCCIEALTGGRYIPRPTAGVLRDIALLDGVPVVRFVDANTFSDPGRAMEISRSIMERGLRKHFFADARADTVVQHPDVFRAWKEAGLRALVIGFEEIDNTRLDRMKKRCDADTHLKAIEILHAQGIRIVGDFIVSPDYTAEDFERLGRFVRSSGIDLPILSILTPLPGTPLYKTLRNNVVISDLDYYTLTNAVVATRLPEEEFYGRYAELLREFHTKPAL